MCSKCNRKTHIAVRHAAPICARLGFIVEVKDRVPQVWRCEVGIFEVFRVPTVGAAERPESYAAAQLNDGLSCGTVHT